MNYVKHPVFVFLLVLVSLGSSSFTRSSLSPEEAAYRAKYEALRSQYESELRSFRITKQRFASIPRGGDVPNINGGRLTPTANTPVTIANTDNATTIRYTPYTSHIITLYYRGKWGIATFSETSLVLAGTLANRVYDIFGYLAAGGTFTLELSAAWSSDTARTDALTTLDGILVKSSDNTRKYLGTFRTDAANRYDDIMITNTGIAVDLWNYYNRVTRHLLSRYNSTNTWTYNAAAYRLFSANASMNIGVVTGIQEVLVRSFNKTNAISANAGANRLYTTGTGLNTVTTNSALLMGGRANDPTPGVAVQIWSEYAGYPTPGGYNINGVESSPSVANITGWGVNGNNTAVRSGMWIIYEG